MPKFLKLDVFPTIMQKSAKNTRRLHFWNVYDFFAQRIPHGFTRPQK